MGTNNTPRKSCENFLNDAFEYLGVDPEMQQLLRSPYREVRFELPLKRDDGTVQEAVTIYKTLDKTLFSLAPGDLGPVTKGPSSRSLFPDRRTEPWIKDLTQSIHNGASRSSVNLN